MENGIYHLNLLAMAGSALRALTEGIGGAQGGVIAEVAVVPMEIVVSYTRNDGFRTHNDTTTTTKQQQRNNNNEQRNTTAARRRNSSTQTTTSTVTTTTTARTNLANWQVYWQLRLHRKRTSISGCRWAARV